MRKAFFLVLVLLLSTTWAKPQRSESVAPSFVFPLSVSGKSFTTNLSFPFRADKVKDKGIAATLLGQNNQDQSVAFLDLLHADPSGRFFLYFDGRNADGTTSMRVATNPGGIMTSTLTGSITQDGFFWIAGSYSLGTGSIADGFAQGKATFTKGTFEPTKISGVLNFTSVTIGESFTLKFKTVGKPTSVPQ